MSAVTRDRFVRLEKASDDAVWALRCLEREMRILRDKLIALQDYLSIDFIDSTMSLTPARYVKRGRKT